MKQMCWACGEAPAVTSHSGKALCGDCMTDLVAVSAAPRRDALTKTLNDIVDMTLARYGISVPQARTLRVGGKNA